MFYLVLARGFVLLCFMSAVFYKKEKKIFFTFFRLFFRAEVFIYNNYVIIFQKNIDLLYI